MEVSFLYLTIFCLELSSLVRQFGYEVPSIILSIAGLACTIAAIYLHDKGM